MGVGSQCHTQATLPPGRDPLPIVQDTGWDPGPVWTGTAINSNSTLNVLIMLL
jgi:hypothetical protein